MRSFRWRIIAIGLAVSLSTAACLQKDAPDVTVTVSGTAGLEFSGSLGALGNSRSVEGRVRATFTIPGTGSYSIFTAVLQKQSTAGTLSVTLNCPTGGPVTQSTSAEYGVVTVSCGP